MVFKIKFTTKILLLSVLPIFILFLFLQALQTVHHTTLSEKTTNELESALYDIYTRVAKMKSQDLVDNLCIQSVGVKSLNEKIINEEIGRNGFAFLMKGNGDILSIPKYGFDLLNQRKQVSPKDNKQILSFNLKDTQSKTLQRLSSEIQNFKEYNIYTIRDKGGTNYLVSFQKIPQYSLEKADEKNIHEVWYLSLVVPLSDIATVSDEITQPIMANFASKLDTTILWSLIILFFVLLFAIFFTFRETKQIRLINNAIRNIKKREFNDSIEIVSNDDLGDLAQTFNEMTIEIQKTYQELENHAIELEDKVKERTEEIEEKNRQLEELVVRDHLTGLYNRTKLDQVLDYEFNRAKRYETVFGVILVDIDFFKMVNDTHGHQVGDEVLCEFSTLLQNNSRDTDTVGRWGGEEFLIIVEDTNEDAIIKLAEKLRTSIMAYEFSVVKKKTASFGLSIYKTGDEINAIIARADEALYKAKKNGRNRVEFL